MASIKSLKNKNIKQLLIALAVIIFINIIMSFWYARLDLTSEKRYTLSNFTKNTLKKLPGKVYITVYLDGQDLPLNFKKFKKSIIEQLEEFKVFGRKNVEYNFVNPYDEKMTDQQRQDLFTQLHNLGIFFVQNTDMKKGQATQTLIVPAAVIKYTYFDYLSHQTVTRQIGLNLLNNDPNYDQSSPENINNSIQTLEYKFINEITKLKQITKPKVVFLEGQGELPEGNVIDFERSLAEYYDVLRGEIKGNNHILDSIDVLIIAKPTQPFDEKDKFVIDQYVMNGGKVLWLVDGVNVSMDSIYYYDKAFAFPVNTQQLKIDDMLFTYGVRVNTDIVEDLVCSTILLKGTAVTGEVRDFQYNWVYFPLLVTKNDNVINKYIDAIKTEFISSIDTVGKNPNIKKTVLLSTSDVGKVEKVNFPLEIDFKQITEKPQEQTFRDTNVPVAVLLQGEFPSLWKGRVIDRYTNNPQSFKSQSVYTKMIVIADGDICKNVMKKSGETMPLDFDKFSLGSFKGNMQFLINSVNYLTDNSGLMQIRLREFKLRVLDKKVVSEQKTMWQIVNLIVPILLIIIIGLIFNFLRKRRYSR